MTLHGVERALLGPSPVFLLEPTSRNNQTRVFVLYVRRLLARFQGRDTSLGLGSGGGWCPDYYQVECRIRESSAA